MCDRQACLYLFAFWQDSPGVHVMARLIDIGEPQAWGYVADTEGNGGMPMAIAAALYPSADDDWTPVLAGVENRYRALLGREPGPWVPNTDERNILKENPGA